MKEVNQIVSQTIIQLTIETHRALNLVKKLFLFESPKMHE